MILPRDRKSAVILIDEAVKSGAALYRSCRELGITERTYQRWTEDGGVKADGRPGAVRQEPANKLSADERAEIMSVMTSDEYKSLPPSQVVPLLADKERYIASESTFYRVLHEHKMQHRRGRMQCAARKNATTHTATSPNQLWCWDITWLPGPAKGVYFYLYLILDVFSRKIVGWEVHNNESSEQASQLVRKAHLSEAVGIKPLVLHSDNGSPMKGSSLMATLDSLGIASSYSRPRVSNDNAFAESIFRTCKYRPGYPHKGFLALEEARSWVLEFVHWYNVRHCHSGIKFMTPSQRHNGEAKQIAAKRSVTYEAAKTRHPERWSGKTRDWSLPEKVHLNPEKNDLVFRSAL
jgi:transposase InsO family protein